MDLKKRKKSFYSTTVVLAIIAINFILIGISNRDTSDGALFYFGVVVGAICAGFTTYLILDRNNKRWLAE